MQFQQDWPKDKKLQLFKVLQENLEKFCAKICNFSKIGAKIKKITAFTRGKFKEKLPRSYKKDR